MANLFLNLKSNFWRGFPLPFNVETLQAFGALFQIPQYYRKFFYYKAKMLRNYVININLFSFLMRFRKNVIEKSFINWRVPSLVKINTCISDSPCI
jgi:hypothetical protein